MLMAVQCGWLFPCVCMILIHASVIPAERGHDPDPMHDKDHVQGDNHDAKYDHEQFLGKEDAAAYDELTPEQSKEKLGKLLPVIDKDLDGSITEDELKDHINFMQKRYVANDVERTWGSYDESKKEGGLLKWTDYQALVYGVEEGQEETERTKEYETMISRDRRRWKQADISGDDSLDQVEYACFMHPEDCENMKDIVVQETLEDIDKDGDGTISIEEYVGDMYRPDDYPELQGTEPEWVASERDMFRDHRDSNKDGVLDKEEMRNWIMPAGFDHAEAEARHLVHMADDNKDGTLDSDEIMAHYDVFVGSQATDYGEQLQKHDPSEL